MSRALISLALAAVWPALGQVGSIALYTDFRSPVSAQVVEALRQEVDARLDPAGLRLVWKHLPSSGSDVANEVAVVTFQGSCAVLPTVERVSGDRRLGWSHVSEGQVQPFAVVDCDAVLGYVWRGLYVKAPEERELVLGRALGRVVAHELLHIFARTQNHSSHGVDQPTFSVDEMLADRPEYEPSVEAPHILRLNAVIPQISRLPSAQAGKAAYLRGGCGSCHGANGEGSKRAPVLRSSMHLLSPVVLAARLAKGGTNMTRRAKAWKLAPPSLAEKDLLDVVYFLIHPS